MFASNIYVYVLKTTIWFVKESIGAKNFICFNQGYSFIIFFYFRHISQVSTREVQPAT